MKGMKLDEMLLINWSVVAVDDPVSIILIFISSRSLVGSQQLERQQGLTAKQKIPRTTRKRLTTLFDPIDRQRWLQTYNKNHATTF